MTTSRPPLYRNDLQFRTAADANGTPLNVGCGFMVKPQADGGYHRRTMPTAVVVFVLRGSGVHIDWRGRQSQVSAGCMMIYPPGLEHSTAHHADGQWAEFYITLPPQLYQAMQALGSLSPERSIYHPGVDASTIAQFEAILHLMQTTADQDLAQVWAHCHLLLAQMLQRDRVREHQNPRTDTSQSSRTHQQMIQACQLLSESLADRMTPEAVADKLGLGYENFRKLFRAQMGISPGEFRIRRRMDLARKLIAIEKLSNKEVAYQLGYADPFTFSKQFRKYTGQSPAAFRASV